MCVDEGEDDDADGKSEGISGTEGRGVRAAGIQVVIIGFNRGVKEDGRVDDLTLSELCQVRH